jgi:hypothetical protein
VSTSIDDMINRLNRMPALMEQELRRAMTASLIAIERDARSVAPRDTSRLAGSITYRIEGEGLQLTGHVGPSVQYGAPVEFGRRVGAAMPPVDALIPWVRRHWRVPLVGRQGILGGFQGEVQTTNKRYAPRGTPDAAIRGRAFALAIAIARRGIRRRPYMGEAYGKNRAQIELNFRAVGARVVASLTTGRGGGRTL